MRRPPAGNELHKLVLAGELLCTAASGEFGARREVATYCIAGWERTAEAFRSSGHATRMETEILLLGEILCIALADADPLDTSEMADYIAAWDAAMERMRKSGIYADSEL